MKFTKETENEFLFFPPAQCDMLEGTNIQRLERMLEVAHEDGLDNKEYMEYWRLNRVDDFTPEDPEWESVQESMSVRELKKLYHDYTGKPYSYNPINIVDAIYALIYDPETGDTHLVDIGS